MSHKPDYCWIKFSETKNWRKDFLASIGSDAKIFSTYIFDRNSTTNCCEFIPSYALYLAGTSFKTSREMTEDEWDDFDQKIRAPQDDDVQYYHCHFINDPNRRNKAQPIRQFVDCDNDTTVQDVLEYYAGNPW
jgi:hypothetical protein